MVRLVRALNVKRQSTFQLRESLGVLDAGEAGHYRLDSGFGSLSALPFAGRLLLPALSVRILRLRQPAASHHTWPSHPFRKSYEQAQEDHVLPVSYPSKPPWIHASPVSRYLRLPSYSTSTLTLFVQTLSDIRSVFHTKCCC
jgi:hypothetical protein